MIQWRITCLDPLGYFPLPPGRPPKAYGFSQTYTRYRWQKSKVEKGVRRAGKWGLDLGMCICCEDSPPASLPHPPRDSPCLQNTLPPTYLPWYHLSQCSSNAAATFSSGSGWLSSNAFCNTAYPLSTFYGSRTLSHCHKLGGGRIGPQVELGLVQRSNSSALKHW